MAYRKVFLGKINNSGIHCSFAKSESIMIRCQNLNVKNFIVLDVETAQEFVDEMQYLIDELVVRGDD
jgi:hypothetical protein